MEDGGQASGSLKSPLGLSALAAHHSLCIVSKFLSVGMAGGMGAGRSWAGGAQPEEMGSSGHLPPSDGHRAH